MIYNQEVFASLPALAAAFHSAQPFKHVVIDGLFDPDFLLRVAEEFYPPDDGRWQHLQNDQEGKLAISNSEQYLPPTIKQFLRELNAEPFLQQLSALTGISYLLPDPYLLGGGMHCIPPGGKLAIHEDFNKHPFTKLDRRLNVLIYLNVDWPEAYGGALELWDRSMRHCVQRILPLFNRTVVFVTDDFSFHGHPDPLACPQDRVRKSLALYYYTNGRPEAELYLGTDHGTLFQQRPFERQENAEEFLITAEHDENDPVLVSHVDKSLSSMTEGPSRLSGGLLHTIAPQRALTAFKQWLRRHAEPGSHS